MKKVNDNSKLAIQMLIAMVSGILVGLVFMASRESVGADSAIWGTINSILFQNISASEEERQIFKELIARGVKVEIQIIPAQGNYDLAKILK